MAIVLIVEDEPAASRAAVKLCRMFGLDPVPATTLAAALAALARAPLPDFILLDLMLPDGNGTEILYRVREGRLPCRVAIATGTADPAMIAAAEALAPERMMFKPIDIPTLQAWLTS
jgi:two-component system OmpR family response regulator